MKHVASAACSCIITGSYTWHAWDDCFRTVLAKAEEETKNGAAPYIRGLNTITAIRERVAAPRGQTGIPKPVAHASPTAGL
jgi:hypothetical protein